MKLKNNKKGFGIIHGMIILFIVIFLFAMINMLSFNIFKDIMPEINSTLTNQEAIDTLDQSYNRFPPVMDNIILFVLTGIWVLGLVSAFTSDEHPLLFGFMMFAVMFTIIAGMFLGNAYEEIFQDTDLTDMPLEFTITNFILTKMMMIGIGVAITMLLIRFAKNRL